ncbi:MAG: threonine/serine dehydratase [Myxococcota bacterium]|nr:threonine/serine dehydratase [Myxococcota bacterium]
MLNAEAIRQAHARIKPMIRCTPIEPGRGLCAAETEFILKLENTQLTGSFKLRGAAHALMCLDREQRQRGVVAASTGNHGAGVSFAAHHLKIPAQIFVPKTLPASKLRTIEHFGAEIIRHGDDCVESESAARVFAAETGRMFISPYNDEAVIAGQGTVALELFEQSAPLDAIVVAVGGGGLIGGIGTYFKAVSPETQIVAVSPANSCVMHRSLEAGQLVTQVAKETLSDSTAGGIEANSVTFALCQQVIDRSLLVTEKEISDALRLTVARHRTLIEGAAAAAVAGAQKIAHEYAGGRIGIILCGANIPNDILAGVLNAT